MDALTRLFIINTLIKNYGAKNANRRIYPENVFNEQVDVYLNKIRYNSSFGEINHMSLQLNDTQILTNKI